MARAQLMSQDWYRVSDLCPRMRSQVEVSLHDYLGRNWFVLFNRSSGKTVRIPADDFAILRRFDGATSLDEIWNDLAWQGERDLPPQDEFIELISRLYEGGIVAMDALPRTATLARMQAAQGKEWITRLLRSPVSQKVPLANPSKFLRAPWVGPLAHLIFSRLGLVLWLTLVIAGALTAINHWEPLTANLADRALAPSNLIILAMVYPVVKLVHEFAHALGVRRFGGDVSQVGIMFLVFVPMPYVDASEANRFRSHSARAIVTMAGIFAEFAIGATALLLWTEAEPGLWRAVLFNTVFICTISTIFFNGNPLLKFDAYYALADITQTPSLGTRGQKLIERSAKRFLGISPGPNSETAGTSARVWMGGYALASAVYRLFITFSIALIVAGTVPYVGQVLAVWVISGGFLYPNLKALYDLARSPAVVSRKGVVGARVIGLMVALVAVLAFIPAPSRTTVTAVVANGERAAIFSEVEGQLMSLDADVGQILQVGDLILTLDPDRLRVEVSAIAARIDAATTKMRASGQDTRAGLTEALRREVDALRESEAQLTERLSFAQVYAPLAGAWMPETPTLRRGTFIARGQRLGWIDAPETRRLVAHLPEASRRDIERGVTGAQVLLAPGAEVALGPEALSIRLNATRRLADDRLANRFGGPVLTEPTEDAIGYRAVSPGLPVEARFDLTDASVGTQVQLKLMHPPEPILLQIWPRLVSIFTSRFGPGA